MIRYWVWYNKPEVEYCSSALGKFGEGLDRELVRQLAFDKPITKQWPGMVLDDCNLKYVKKKAPPSDFVKASSGYFVASARLRLILESEGVDAEYFPVEITDPEIQVEQAYWFVHLLRGYDAREVLDHEKSKYSYVEATGAQNVKDIVFLEDKAPSDPLLKLRGIHTILVSDRLRVAVEAANITGVYFQDTSDYVEKHLEALNKQSDHVIASYKQKHNKDKTQKRKEKPKKSIKPVKEVLLTEEELEEIRISVDAGLSMVSLRREDSPEELQQAIYERVNEYRTSASPQTEDELINYALPLGCLWGHALCVAQGWEWVFIEMAGNDQIDGLYAVVSPDRKYAAYPMQYMQRLLSDPESDQNSLLLYNMIVDGSNLPQADQNTYQTLA